jgi:Skp family chaperone for outer membrane proteins
MTRHLLGCVLILLGLGGAVVSPARADFKLATVDMEKISAGYTALQDKNKDLQDWQNKKMAYLDKLEDFTLLSNENFLVVVKLLSQDKRSGDEDKKLADLSDEARTKEMRMRDLQAKAPRTTAEDEEFKTLQDQYNNGVQRHKEEVAKANADFDTQRNTAIEGFRKEVQKVAAALAKEQGYGIVMEAGFVLVGGDDITQQVLDKLNGGKAAAPPATPLPGLTPGGAPTP